MPKIELHLHLDCSLSYEVVARLEPSISEVVYRSEFIAPAQCTNLADFLTRAPRGVALMQSEPALRLVTEDLFHQLADDGVVYAEIRFAPLLHTAQGLTPEAVVAAVEEATRHASKASEVEARLVVCTLRHFTEEQSLETVRLAERFRGTLVAALDIAGDEAGFPIDAHVPAFRYAATQGIPRTAHAGEARGPASVWQTLEHLRPSRIGHGVRSIEDSRLVDHLRDEGIHLEVCPTSNVQTNAVSSLEDHPIDRLYRSGVSLGVSTDARTITDVTLADEYERLNRTFGWGPAEFLACNLNALRAAFVPEETRSALEARVRSGYGVA